MNTTDDISEQRELAGRAINLLVQKHSPETVAPNSFEEWGYKYQAPATLGFLQWIERQCTLDGVNKLLFIAPDGYLLEQIARTYFSSRLPDFAYFLGSRIAFNLAAIDEANFYEYLPFLMSEADGLSPGELFERIGLLPPATSVMASLGIDPQKPFAPHDYELIKKLFLGYHVEILKLCSQNRRGLFIYLNQLGIKPGDKIALVSVDSSGTTQDAFECVVSTFMDVEVLGYHFFAVNPGEKHKRPISQKTFLNKENYSAATLDKIDANRRVVELFFSATHDPIIGYKPLKDEVIATMVCGRIKESKQALINAKLRVGVDAFLNDYMQLNPKIREYITPEQLSERLVNALMGEAVEEPLLGEYSATGSS